MSTPGLFQPKKRSVYLEKILTDLDSSYQNIIKDNPSSIIYREKSETLLNNLALKAEAKCAKEISSLNSLGKLEVDANNQPKFTPYEGKESLSQQALIDLNKCQEQFMPTYMTIDLLNNFSQGVMGLQLENCLDGCEKNFKDGTEDVKNCATNCYKSVFNDTLKAVESSLGIYMDALNSEIHKL